MFHYHGNERLQYFFYSPNTFGAFLCMVILLGFYLFLYLAEHKNKYIKLSSIPIFAGIIYLEFILAMTYSRGGYIALLTGIAVLYWIIRKKYCFLLAGTFIFSLICTSAGIQRLASVNNVGNGSIYNRLLLWHGGTGIIANNYLMGMDFSNVGKAYTAWYQPLWLNEIYIGLISDYLNIAVIYGIFVLCGYLIVIFTLTWIALRIAQKSENLLCGALVAAIVSYLLSSTFSTLFLFINVYGVFLAIMGITFIAIIWKLIRGHYKISRQDIAIPVALSILIASTIMIYGSAVNARKSFIYKDIIRGKLRIVKASPKTTPKALIVYVFNSKNTLYVNAIRNNVRPLANLGYEVWAIGVDSGFNGQNKLKKILKSISTDCPVILIGQSDGGKQAIVAASSKGMPEFSGVVILGSPASWPFDELSPILHINNLKAPLLLIHGSEDKANHPSESLVLKKLCDKNNIPANCKIIKGVDSHFTNVRGLVFNIIDKFVSEQLKKNNAKLTSQLKMQVFYKPGCKHCQDYESVINKVRNEYAGKIQVKKHNILNGSKQVLYFAYRKLYGVDHGKIQTPAVFMSDRFLAGESSINDTLGVLKEIFASGKYKPTREATVSDIKNAESKMIEDFKKLPMFTILIAGLIDGINPCVFSTLIFFMSLLTVSKVKNRKLLIVGAIYCLSCYISYFLMGLGILSIFNIVNKFQFSGLLLNYGMIGLLFVLSFFSLRDAYYYRKIGKAENITLQLPDNLKKRIHKIMHKAMHYKYLLPGIFFVGLCVTLIESACSGQVYIPVISIISKHGSFSLTSILYLALYNFMCIIPVFAVLAFTYYGTTTSTFIRWVKKDVVIGKLSMSALFILLAVLMILF